MAFTAGIVSFLSPCILPIIPGYISFISGVSLQDIREADAAGRKLSRLNGRVLLNSICFILGFSLVFTSMGASATWAGTFLSTKISLMTKIAGVVIVIFGLFKMGILRILFLFKEVKFEIRKKKFGLVGAMVIGAAFGFGWTPCIGPILAGILTYAATLEKVNQGILLLSVYSIGLGIPFLLTAMGVNQFFFFFDRVKKHLGLFEKITGGVMVIIGLMILTDSLTMIPGYLSFLNAFSL
jgi:cytochrome c-type biogenesis protein